MSTLYWYDYETFGRYPQTDRVAQFAGLRTDLSLNIVEEPHVYYCQQSLDYLPHPEACLLTGISPQKANALGVCESVFSQKIFRHFSQANTCVVGYNNIRFDDELTRFLFYRNFLDPYQREYKNGNSRWDLLDVVRLCYALRPEGVEWPINDEGQPSFKLEKLTVANGIAHEEAHDALADVHATIALARLIKAAQPKLFDYAFQHRHKTHILSMLNCYSKEPVVHISGQYSAYNGCCAVVLPLLAHPTNKNGIIVYDLSVNPEPLLTLSSEEIHQRVFTKQIELPEGVKRIPLKVVHINRCPIITPLKTLRAHDAERLHISVDECLAHAELLKSASSLANKLSEVFTDPSFNEADEHDTDTMLYSGGFFSAHDKSLMADILQTLPGELLDAHFSFQDKRLDTMLFRYCGRNFFDTLSEKQRKNWLAFCRERLSLTEAPRYLNYAGFCQLLETLKTTYARDKKALDMLHQLEQYGRDLSLKIGLS